MSPLGSYQNKTRSGCSSLVELNSVHLYNSSLYYMPNTIEENKNLLHLKPRGSSHDSPYNNCRVLLRKTIPPFYLCIPELMIPVLLPCVPFHYVLMYSNTL